MRESEAVCRRRGLVTGLVLIGILLAMQQVSSGGDGPGKYLLFPFMSNILGFDGGIAVVNTGADPFGTPGQSGTVTLKFYGDSAPSPVTSPLVAPGGLYETALSAVAPGFQGYVIATTTFSWAQGRAMLFSGAGPAVLAGHLARVIDVTKHGAGAPPTTALLFPYVSNRAGMDTGIVIANTSRDPFGTTETNGRVVFDFYGLSAPPAYTTTVVNAGSVYPTMCSTIAPGFGGYVIARCSFPCGEGYAFISDAGSHDFGDCYLAEIVDESARGLWISAAQWQGANVVVQFPTAVSQRYDVVHSPTLLDTNWSVLTNRVTGTGGTVSIADPATAGASERFYRVVLTNGL